MTIRLLPIERVRDLSQTQFEGLLLYDRPVIIEGGIEDWHACERWRPEYFAEKVGDLRIRLKVSSTHIHPDFEQMRMRLDFPLLFRMLAETAGRILGRDRSRAVEMTLREFLVLLGTPSLGCHYMAGAEELSLLYGGKWNEALAALRADFQVPRYIPQTRLDSAALWVSGKGVRSHLHYDGHCLHNLNAQITGSKHVQLYSPAQMDKMYPYLYTRGQPYTFSRVNVEDVDESKFPLFRELEGFEATLQPGDLLLIPAYWYHTFKHLGDFNTNVNFWWRAEFVRLTPASAREYLGTTALAVLAQAKIPPIWLVGWLRKIERRMIGSR